VEDLQSPERRMLRTVMLHSITFVLGFSVVFIALGAVATSVGQLFNEYHSLLSKIAGIVVIIFGLHLTGLLKIKALYADKRMHEVKGGSSALGSFVVGFAFAFGWTPCIGPILATILVLASAQGTVLKGIILLAVYSLGLAVPFLLTSLLMERFLKFYSRFRSHMHALEVASGALMIGLGVLLVTGRFTLISTWLSFLNRLAIWLEGITTKNAGIAILVLAALMALAIYLAVGGQRRRPEEQAPETPANEKTSNRNPLALVVAALVVAGMLFFGFHMARRSAPSRAGQVPETAKVIEAPDFTLESLEGKSVRLSDLRGKAVLLNFWATWCVPCKIEMPWLVELQGEYGPQGLQIVGVAMDDSSKEDIAKFVKDMGVNYPVLLGKEAVGDAYGGVPGLPESFFISRDGRIVDKIIGLKGKADIEDAIRKALSAQPGTSQATPTAQAVTDPK